MSQMEDIQGMKRTLEEAFAQAESPYTFVDEGTRTHMLSYFELTDRVAYELELEEPIRVIVALYIDGFSVDVYFGRRLTEEEVPRAKDFVDCWNAEGKALGHPYMYLRLQPVWSQFCEWMDECPLTSEYLRCVIFKCRCNAAIFFRDMNNHFRWGHRNLDRVLSQYGKSDVK